MDYLSVSVEVPISNSFLFAKLCDFWIFLFTKDSYAFILIS